MSTKPILPLSPKPSGDWESRLTDSLNRELTELKTKANLAFEDRLASNYSATAAPTGGKWIAGDRIRNSTPAEAGGAGSKYVIIGWICTATGTPGTWLEMRTLTGN